MNTLSLRYAAAVAGFMLVFGCAEQGPAGSTDTTGNPTSKAPVTISGTARFVNGATSLSDGGPPTAGARATFAGGADNWLISPNRVRVRIKAIMFMGERGSGSELTNCEVNYDRAAPSLSTLLDCKFTVDTGSYTAIAFHIDSTFHVLVDDAANGWFTDPTSPTLFSSTRPANGAGFVDINIQNGTTLYLTEPLVITPNTPALSVTVAMHGLHTMQATRTDGTPKLMSAPKIPLFAFPSLNGVGSTEFYSSTGTGNNYAVATTTSEFPMGFAVFYGGQGPAALYFVTGLGGSNPCAPGNPPGGKGNVQATSPKVSPLSKDGNKAGGFLGMDATGTISWALGKTADYSVYHSIWSMPRAGPLGQPVQLKCFATSTAPDPVSGNTYSSGAPAIPSPSAAWSVKLVAR